MVNDEGIYNGVDRLLWAAVEHLAATPAQPALDRMLLGLFGTQHNGFNRVHAERAAASFDALVKVEVNRLGSHPRAKPFNQQKTTALFGALDTFCALAELVAPVYHEQARTAVMDAAALRARQNILNRDDRIRLADVVGDLFDRLSFERMAAPQQWGQHEAEYQRLVAAFKQYLLRESTLLPELVHGSTAERVLLREGALAQDLVPGLISLTRVYHHNFKGAGLESDSPHLYSPYHRELLAAGMTAFEGVLPHEQFSYVPVQIDRVRPDSATAAPVSKAQASSHKEFLIPNPVLDRLAYAQALADQVMTGQLHLEDHERTAVIEAAKAELALVVSLLDDTTQYIAANLRHEQFGDLGKVPLIEETPFFGLRGTRKRPFEGVTALSDMKGLDTSIITARYAAREGSVRASQSLLEGTLQERHVTPRDVVLLPRFQADAPKLPDITDVTPAEVALAGTNAYLALQAREQYIAGGDILTTPIGDLHAAAKKHMDKLKQAADAARAERKAVRGAGPSDVVRAGHGAVRRGGYDPTLLFDLGGGYREGGLMEAGLDLVLREAIAHPSVPASSTTVPITVEPQATADYDGILKQNKAELNIPALVYAGLMTAASLARAAEAGVVMLPQETWGKVGGQMMVGERKYTPADGAIIIPHEAGMLHELIGRPFYHLMSNGRGQGDERADVTMGRHPSIELTRMGEPGSFFDQNTPLHQRTGTVAIKLVGGQACGYELFLQRAGEAASR